MKLSIIALACLSAAPALFAQVVPRQDQAGIHARVTVPAEAVIAHDPVMIRQDDTYYLFTTGPGVTVWSSPDMKIWSRESAVFDPYPAWAPEEIAGFQGHIWAPDISYHDGRYYLYYSISAFGKNTSAIGLATNVTLHPDDPDFKWEDHGIVLQSFPGLTNWNAIDANIIEDDDGTGYMSFGSFWGGLQLVRLTPDRMAIDGDIDDVQMIASRRTAKPEANGKKESAAPGSNAIEAPFIFKHNDYFYLFASIDYCCRGPESTYKMIVGRSKSLTGPYVDREDVLLTRGGGTLLLAGDENWHGVGHNAVVHFDGTDYLVFHGYDAHEDGVPKLLIRTLAWDADGWPTATLAQEDAMPSGQ